MNDPHAFLRKELQDHIAFVADRVMAAWQPRIEALLQRDDPAARAAAAQLRGQMDQNITHATQHWVRALALLPPPPVIVTMDGDRIVRIEHA